MNLIALTFLNTVSTVSGAPLIGGASGRLGIRDSQDPGPTADPQRTAVITNENKKKMKNRLFATILFRITTVRGRRVGPTTNVNIVINKRRLRTNFRSDIFIL